MTAHKHLKQLVRSRMAKTGERYAAARRHIIAHGNGQVIPRDGSLDDFPPAGAWHFAGSVPATTALRVLLSHAGVLNPVTKQPFSEPMLFGIAGGIGIGLCQFVYEKEDFASFFVAGRHLWHDDQAYLERAIKAFGIKPIVEETTGAKTAEKKLIDAFLSKGAGPLIAWCDMATFPHRGMPAWMQGGSYHVVTVYGIEDDGKTAVVGDMTDEPIRVAMSDLTAARMRIKKYKCRTLRIDPAAGAAKTKVDLKSLVYDGLKRCAAALRKPDMKAMQNWFKLDALKVWADRITDEKSKDGWPNAFKPGKRMWTGLTGIHDYIENYGTGGGLCRPMFADFLAESAEALGDKKLAALGKRYAEIGAMWSHLADAALPDSVPLFAQAKKLLDARNERLTAEPDAESSAKGWAEIESLKKQAAAKFPLNDSESAALRLKLKEHALVLHAAETAALNEIEQAMA
jgi:hypothetical protein